MGKYSVTNEFLRRLRAGLVYPNKVLCPCCKAQGVEAHEVKHLKDCPILNVMDFGGNLR